MRMHQSPMGSSRSFNAKRHSVEMYYINEGLQFNYTSLERDRTGEKLPTILAYRSMKPHGTSIRHGCLVFYQNGSIISWNNRRYSGTITQAAQ